NSNATVTYYTNTFPNTYPYQISENGGDVSLKVTVGGENISYVNTSIFPNLATLNVYRNPTNYPVYPSGDTVDIAGTPPNSPPGYNPGFGLSLTTPSDTIFSQVGPNNSANLLNFDFAGASLGNASYTNAMGVLDSGTITAVEAVTTPEP